MTPRLAAAYDLFGNGKTALKTSLNKYVVAQGVQGPYGDAIAPVNRLANFVTRTWNDQTFPVGDPRRSNFFPDCDLTNVLANGECGNLSDTNFGKPTPSTTVDPRVLDGFGVRPYNWEFSASVQHELAPRVSVDFGYFRRWFGNFAVTDNLALAPSDFTAFSHRRAASTRGCPTAAATRSTASSIATPTRRRWRPTTSSRWRATTATRSSSGTAST